MIFFRPCLFLLLDSWLESAACADVEELAGCTVALLVSVDDVCGAEESEAAGVVAAEAGCAGSAAG